jgi:hypothetical protein
MAKAGERVRMALRDVDPNDPPTANLFKRWWARQTSSAENAKWGNLFSAWSAYVSEAVAVQRGTAGAERDIARMVDDAGVPVFPGGPRAIVAALSNDAASAVAKADYWKGNFREQTGLSKTPGYVDADVDKLRELEALDYRTYDYTGKSTAKPIPAPPGAKEGETLYNNRIRYRIQGGQAVPY